MKRFLAAAVVTLLAALAFASPADGAPKKKYDKKATDALREAAVNRHGDDMPAARSSSSAMPTTVWRVSSIARMPNGFWASFGRVCRRSGWNCIRRKPGTLNLGPPARKPPRPRGGAC